MSEILISWMAMTHDFTKNDNGRTIAKPGGTHDDLYQQDFGYKKHYLLSSAQELRGDLFCDILSNHLLNNYDIELKPTFLEIEDVINIELIQDKLRPFLLDKRDKEIDVFISPGTPAMQTAWYLLAQEFPNLNLFQIRPPNKRNQNESHRIYLEVNKENISNAMAVRQKIQGEQKQDSDIYKSNSIQKLYDFASTIANPYKVTTLLLGQTGTGKEWLAKHIHEKSLRKNKKFRAVNCAALNDELLQSTLFGHVRGAFSDAVNDVKGYFETANGGTLFLDEIGDISNKLQQSLLRVLQEGVVYRLGDNEKKIKVDVRIIAATNKDLFQMTEEGTFRLDLYHRLAIAEIETIPFRELPYTEITEYFNFFIKKWKRKLKRKKSIILSKEVKQCINLYRFPGNFREADNLIQRFYTYVNDDNLVTMDMLPKRIQSTDGTKASLKIEDVKKAHYKKVFEMFKENKTKMGEALGVSQNTLKATLKKFKLI